MSVYQKVCDVFIKDDIAIPLPKLVDITEILAMLISSQKKLAWRVIRYWLREND